MLPHLLRDSQGLSACFLNPEPCRTIMPGHGPGQAHRAPNHISKIVLSIVKIDPPDLIKSRNFTLRVRLTL